MSAEALLDFFVRYGYWIAFLAIVLDNAGLPIPGELVLLLFGALARTGELDLGLGLAVGAAAAMSGDSIGYWLGRLNGDRLLRAYCRLTLGSGMCVTRAVGYYDRYGLATIVVGRFVMGVRVFLAPLAGAAGMPFRRFVLVDALGAFVWAGLFLALGYAFGWQLEAVHGRYRAGAALVLAVLGLSAGLYLVVKLLRRRRHGVAAIRQAALAHVVDVLGAARHPEHARSGSSAPPPACAVDLDVGSPPEQTGVSR